MAGFAYALVPTGIWSIRFDHPTIFSVRSALQRELAYSPDRHNRISFTLHPKFGTLGSFASMMITSRTSFAVPDPIV
jgi:hypothetical protein